MSVSIKKKHEKKKMMLEGVEKKNIDVEKGKALQRDRITQDFAPVKEIKEPL